jgi:hypothetical protein
MSSVRVALRGLRGKGMASGEEEALRRPGKSGT